MLQKVDGQEAAELPTNQKLLESLYERAGKQLDDWKAAGRVFLEAYDRFEADLGSREILRGEYRQAWFASTGESKPVWLGNDDAAAKRIPDPRQLFTLDPEIGQYLEMGKVEALLRGLCDLQENALEWNLSRRARLLAANAVEGLISKVRELRASVELKFHRDEAPAIPRGSDHDTTAHSEHGARTKCEANTDGFVAALSSHHGYDNGQATKFDPVESAAALARGFDPKREGAMIRAYQRRFKDHFGGMGEYRRACKTPAMLSVILARLNREPLGVSVSRAKLGDLARHLRTASADG